MLFLIYAISIIGFLRLIISPFGLNFEPNILALIVSAIGIGFGFIFYFISLLKSSIKSTIFVGITGFIFLMIFLIYFLMGLLALFEFVLGLIKFGFFMLMFMIPAIGVYSLFKKQKTALIMSGGGALFFYFFVLILSRNTRMISVPFYSANEIIFLMFYFFLIILYLEIGSASINFDNVIKKISPNENHNEFIISRFNIVFNRYLIQVPLLILLIYVLSLSFFWKGEILNINEIFGIKLTSSLGTFLLVFITIISAFIFWYLIPREKAKKG
jgi:hypothetical protein